jgi:hypothetical protein
MSEAGPQDGTGAVQDLGRPSFAPTLIVTILFGVFGLVPAVRHSRMARRRGFSTNGYWWAFFAPFVAWAGLVEVAVAALAIAGPTLSPTSDQAGGPTGNGTAAAPSGDGGSSSAGSGTGASGGGASSSGSENSSPLSTEIGTVTCESGAPVEGVYIKVYNNSGSGFAQWSLESAPSSARYSYSLPESDSWSVDVGCGGSATKWLATVKGPYVIGSQVSWTCYDSGTSENGASAGQCVQQNP